MKSPQQVGDPRRVVEPEWLDTLPPEDAGAIGSRRDLERVNWLMGNGATMARELRRLGRAQALVEIGAGSGTFLLDALRRSGLRPATVVLVDRQPVVSSSTREGFRALGCEVRTETADVFEFLSATAAPIHDAIVANLFLHHFDTPRLSRLLGLVALRSHAFVACETRRSATAMAGARLLGLVGCNRVTRHDAVVSIRAGFGDGDLSALWPPRGWATEERARGLFGHSFVARRQA